MNSNDDKIRLINFPILIDAHPHPLILSICQRENWVCDKCSESYSPDIESFYCTFCDYDLCKKCLGKYQLDNIKEYNFNKRFHITSKKILPFQIEYKNHEHFLSKIQKRNKWVCDDCQKTFENNNITSYYCSLCDYDICEECATKKANSFEKIKQEDNNEMNCSTNSGCSDSDDDYYVPKKIEPPRRIMTKKKKPVIYLYPQKEMDVSVQLDMNLNKSKFTTIYPKFNEGNNIWNVHAMPNGDIQIKDKIYPYLFWEADSYFLDEMNEGFIVKAENAEKFLEEKLNILGLNDKESTDFITFWLPTLLNNKISLCTFQNEKYFNNFKLNVTPKPDVVIRVFLSIKKIDSEIEVKEQKLSKNERKGFTVIEWGGSSF